MRQLFAFVTLLCFVTMPARAVAQEVTTVTKTACRSVAGFSDDQALKETLLADAKRMVVSELFGELISASTTVENLIVTNEQVQATSLGFIHVRGNPVYSNGADFGEVCVTLEAEVTPEDLELFVPDTVTAQDICNMDPALTTAQLRSATRAAAAAEALYAYDPRLSALPRASVLLLLRRVSYAGSDFVGDSDVYCAQLEAEVLPIEVMILLGGAPSDEASAAPVPAPAPVAIETPAPTPVRNTPSTPTSPPAATPNQTATEAAFQLRIERALAAQATQTALASTAKDASVTTPSRPPTVTPVNKPAAPQVSVPTAAPTAAPATASAPAVASAATDANLRVGPGTAFEVVARVSTGEVLAIVGRNEDGTWFLLDEGAWIAASLVHNAPPLAQLQVALPASTPTPKSAVAQNVDRPETLIPSGTFVMGCITGDALCHGSEQPQHAVTLDAFWIDNYEVTNALYQKCVQAGGCTPPQESSSSSRGSYYGNASYANYPVINVTWWQATAFCQWAGGRLPSEAEWEKAARGTFDSRLYAWGSTAPNQDYLNFNGNVGDTMPVGSYPNGASPYGVFDMGGNVWEWVNDWYGFYNNAPEDNPVGPDSGLQRVLRGGSWNNDASGVRASARAHVEPDVWDVYFGFRCAR